MGICKKLNKFNKEHPEIAPGIRTFLAEAFFTLFGVLFAALACSLVLFTAGIEDFFETMYGALSGNSIVFAAGAILLLNFVKSKRQNKILAVISIMVLMVIALYGAGTAVFEAIKDNADIAATIEIDRFLINICCVISVCLISGIERVLEIDSSTIIGEAQ